MVHGLFKTAITLSNVEVLFAYFPFGYTVVKRCELKGKDLIKLIIFSFTSAHS